MKLDDVIVDIDRNISAQEREITNLKNKKIKFQKIKEQYPNAHYESGAICISDIWDKVTCMRIERKNRWYYTSASKINVKFLLPKKTTIENMKIYTYPFETTVSEIKSTAYYSRGNFSTNGKNKEILIFDYKKIIPMECPKRNSFIKRIKLYLIDTILENGLTISDSSFDKEEITKLMLLR